MIKLKLELAQGPQAIDFPVDIRQIASPTSMQAVVRESSKLYSMIKDIIDSQTEADRVLVQDIKIAGKTCLVDRYYSIAPEVECSIYSRQGYIILRYPNS